MPWKLIAETVSEDSRFCSSTGSNSSRNQKQNDDTVDRLNPSFNYAYKPNHAVNIKMPKGTTANDSLQEIEVNVAKWVGSSWEESGKVNASIESDEIILSFETKSEGFFKLSFAVGPHREPRYLDNYAIISDNWKRDILAFCRESKYRIEANPDVQLIRSSIASSHFDHTMDIVSRASFLSGKILKALANAVQNKKTFEAGLCPNLVIGLNKIRLKRFAGAQIAEFVIHVPANYASSKKWPVYIHMDPARWGVGKYGREPSHRDGINSYHKGMIDLWLHTATLGELQWKEYMLLLEILKQKLSVDEDRIYIYGYCGGGVIAMSMALHYPDEWAEININLGNSYNNLAGNALNLNMNFIKTAHYSEITAEAWYDFAAECFKYYDCSFIKNQKTWEEQPLGGYSPEASRKLSPQRVLFTADSLQTAKAYWVQINGRIDENLVGEIDALVKGQTILVKTDNIDAYSLDLEQAPVDSNKPVKIVENGQSLGFITGRSFTKEPDKYRRAKYVKNDRLSGPVWDAFTDPYVVAYGTGSEDKSFSEISRKLAKSLANGAPYFADVNVPEKLADGHNLILVGIAESNLGLAKVCEDLPIQIRNGKVSANGIVYDGNDVGFILVYPNLINPGRYVAVFSATSSRAMANIFKAYSQMKSTQPADVGIFEITDGSDIKWRIIEKFSTIWDWHNEWDQVLAITNKKHHTWQWRQWVAKTLRKQLEADVAICGDHFRFKDSAPEGQITSRELFNSFRNDWVVKVRLDGKTLRSLLTSSFNDPPETKIVALTVDGVSLVKPTGDHERTALGINELENDEKYTVTLPYKAINWQRMGIVLKDYKIVGEGYLVPLLKDYLCRNKNLNFDAQLDSLELNTF